VRDVNKPLCRAETNEWAYVITVYEPDLEHFEADYKTRRKDT